MPSTADFSCVEKSAICSLLACRPLPFIGVVGAKFEMMTSFTAEPGRKRAYDSGLRWRIIYQRIGMNYTYQKIAHNLNISVCTAQRIFQRFKATNSVDPTSIKSRECLHSLLNFISVFDNPAHELCSIIHSTFNISVSPPTVCRVLRRHGITRKKMQQVASEMRHLERSIYGTNIPVQETHVCLGR